YYSAPPPWGGYCFIPQFQNRALRSRCLFVMCVTVLLFVWATHLPVSPVWFQYSGGFRRRLPGLVRPRAPCPEPLACRLQRWIGTASCWLLPRCSRPWFSVPCD